MDEREELRRQYRPQAVRVLLVGEAAPAGGTFFYLANSNLYRSTRQGFAAALGEVAEGAAFLRQLQGWGVYLVDLCGEPVNRQDVARRREAHQRGVARLAEEMRALAPQAIICVMRGIAPYVAAASARAGLGQIPFYSAPFPSQGNQRRYVAELAEMLEALGEAGIFTVREAPSA